MHLQNQPGGNAAPEILTGGRDGASTGDFSRGHEIVPAPPYCPEDVAMKRCVAYAWAGALFSAGAPVGLLAVRGPRRDQRTGRASWRHAVGHAVRSPVDYIYVGLSTAAAFTMFGYVLGRQADRLAQLSETDPLTGLANARRLFGTLDVELARSKRYGDPLALVLVDLDGLKRINDCFGHHAGDEAIRGVAAVIRSQLRQTDVAARWGGDEFAVLAPGTSREAAVALAERIRASIPQHGHELELSGSLGVAAVHPVAGEDTVDSSALMRAADAALYEAKRTGRNKVVVAPSPRAQE